MVTRLLVMATFGLTIWLAWTAATWWVGQRTRRVQQLAVPLDLDGLGIPQARPAILYFTTAMCGICRLQQAPVLEQVRQRLRDGVAVVQLDALEADRLARHYGVLTVPTTVVLDAARRPVHINHGLAPASTLLAQVGQVTIESPKV